MHNGTNLNLGHLGTFVLTNLNIKLLSVSGKLRNFVMVINPVSLAGLFAFAQRIRFLDLVREFRVVSLLYLASSHQLSSMESKWSTNFIEDPCNMMIFFYM